MLERIQREEDPHTLSMSLHFGAAIMGKSMEIPQKTKNSTTIWPSCSTSAYLSREFLCRPTCLHRPLHSSTIKGCRDTSRWAQRPPAPVVWQARWGLSTKGTRGPRILERLGPGRVPEPGRNLERDSWEAKLWQEAPCVVCNHWCTAP